MDNQMVDYNFLNQEAFKKTMVCWKITKKTDSEILKKIKTNFHNPEEFLKIDKDLIVGKKINMEKFKNKDEVKPYHVVGNIENLYPNIKNTNANKLLELLKFPRNIRSSKINIKDYSDKILKNISNINISRKKNKIRNTNLINTNTMENEPYSKEFISDEQIDKLFTDKKAKINISCLDKSDKEKVYNEEIIKNVDYNCASEMKDYLIKQEKALDLKTETDKRINNLSKFIARKSLKSENELLMNKTDAFRLKNQCIQRIQSSNPSKTYKYGIDNEWKLNLRKNICEDIKKISKNENYNNIFNINENFRKGFYENSDKVRKSKTKNFLGIKNHLNIREDNTDIAAVVFDFNKNEDIVNIVKPNTASIKDFKLYTNCRTISSKMREINLTCDEMINPNNLNVIN